MCTMCVYYMYTYQTTLRVKEKVWKPSEKEKAQSVRHYCPCNHLDKVLRWEHQESGASQDFVILRNFLTGNTLQEYCKDWNIQFNTIMHMDYFWSHHKIMIQDLIRSRQRKG